MFLKYDIPPARLERLFTSFGRQAVRVDYVRRRHRFGIVAGLTVFVIATTILLGSPAMFGMTPNVVPFFGALVAVGLFVLGIGWLVSGYLARPRQPFHGSSLVILSGTGIIFFGLPLLKTPLIPETARTLIHLVRTNVSADVWVAWALAAAGVFLASRFIVWLRLSQASVQLGELDSMKRTVVPLLRDVPPDASCSLVCNPYPPRWTVTARIVTQGTNRLGIYDDVLLDFQAVLPSGDACSVKNSHRRIDKYKIRKQKFKGRKHVVAQQILIERPGCGPLQGDAIARFERLAERLAAADPTCVAVAAHETTDGVLRLSLKRKWKFAHPAEQPADKLPDPRATLAAVRTISRFAAGLGR